MQRVPEPSPGRRVSWTPNCEAAHSPAVSFLESPADAQKRRVPRSKLPSFSVITSDAPSAPSSARTAMTSSAPPSARTAPDVTHPGSADPFPKESHFEFNQRRSDFYEKDLSEHEPELTAEGLTADGPAGRHRRRPRATPALSLRHPGQDAPQQDEEAWTVLVNTNTNRNSGSHRVRPSSLDLDEAKHLAPGALRHTRYETVTNTNTQRNATVVQMRPRRGRLSPADSPRMHSGRPSRGSSREPSEAPGSERNVVLVHNGLVTRTSSRNTQDASESDFDAAARHASDSEFSAAPRVSFGDDQLDDEDLLRERRARFADRRREANPNPVDLRTLLARGLDGLEEPEEDVQSASSPSSSASLASVIAQPQEPQDGHVRFDIQVESEVHDEERRQRFAEKRARWDNEGVVFRETRGWDTPGA